MTFSPIRRSIVPLSCAFALLAASAAATAADQSKGADSPPSVQRVEVPIRIVYQPNGAVRLAILVQIGDAPPVEALLDTGSSGLRVLPGVLPRAAYGSTPTSAAITYSSGVTLRGNVA